MNSLTKLNFDEYINTINQYTIPIENGGNTTIKLKTITSVPLINRSSMKTADLEKQIPFMPRDLFKLFTAWIGTVMTTVLLKRI